MQAALHRETGDLERLAGAGGLPPGPPAAGFGGRTTADAIRIGSFRATAALVGEGVAAAGAGATVVLTGGNGAALAPWLGAPVILRPRLVLEGLALAGPAAAYAVGLRSGAGVAGLNRFVVMPMFLFSGTFFPVDELPRWAETVAWLVPPFHGVELCRAATLGVPTAMGWLGHSLYLAAWAVVGYLLASRRFSRRLTD